MTINSNWNGFWTRRWFWALALALAGLPYLFAAIPPLMDLPGHMARYHIIRNLATSPDLQRYYGFHWELIGNLGVDLIVMALGPVLGVEKATWMVSLLTLLLTGAALPALSKAVHGKIQPTVLLALPFLYAHNFHFGFLNYALSVAFALWALVLWLKMEKATPLWRAVIFVPVSALIWLCHAMGWGIFALCAGLVELQRQHATGKSVVAVVGQTALRVWPLAVPLALILLWRQQGGAPSGYASNMVADKIRHLVSALRDQNQILDIGTMAVLIFCVFALLREKIASAARPMLWASLGLWVAFALMPTFVFGSYYADARLVHVAAVLTLVSLKWQHPSPKLATSFSLATGLLFAARMAVTTMAWISDSRAVQQHLTALNLVPVGARVLVVNRVECDHPRWKIDYHYWHLSDMAVVRRNAFVNSMWFVPGAEALTIRYNLDTPYYADPSQYVSGRPCSNIPKTLAMVARDFPRNRFDYVWMLRLDGTPQPMPADLVPLYRDPATALYKVRRSPL
jgi:hypothetical protein